MSSRFSPRCASTHFDKDEPEHFADSVQQDFRDIGKLLNASATIYLTAPDRLVIPVIGSVTLYIVTNTATAGSTGIAYHTIVGTRSGQQESALPGAPSLSIDTRNAEMAAYTRYAIGQYNVGPGDVLSYALVVTGAPAPTLTSANLSLLCVFTPTDIVS